MLSSKVEQMLKRPFCTWMVDKLMEMLFERSLRYHHERRCHLPESLSLLLQRKILPKMIVPVLMWKRMDRNAQENLLPVGNLLPHARDRL